MSAHLLVSVRSVAEAETFIDLGVQIVDIKEPNNGGLGAAEPSVWRSVAAKLPDETLGSVAMGELSERQAALLTTERDSLTGIDFAKVGLANASEHWAADWMTWRRSLPAHVQPVAVVYADWKCAKAPKPAEVFAATADEAPVLLIDTFDKSRGRLTVASDELKELAENCRTTGRQLAIAGRLSYPLIADALERVRPDIVAVRSLVCRDADIGDIDARLGEVCRVRVARLLHFLQSPETQAEYRTF